MTSSVPVDTSTMDPTTGGPEEYYTSSAPPEVQIKNNSGLIVAVVTCSGFALLVLGWLAFVAARRLSYCGPAGCRKWSMTSTSDESERIFKADRSSLVNGTGWIVDLFRGRSSTKRRASIPFHVPTVISTTSFDGSCGGRRMTFDQSMLGGTTSDIGNVNLALSSDRLASVPAASGTNVDSMVESTTTEFHRSAARDRRRRSADVLPSSGVQPNRRASISCGLGGIDPALYRIASNSDEDYEDTGIGGVCHVFPEGHIGRVRLGVHYQRDTERLTVRLIQARNLPSRHSGTANACDPFVRICLLPDTRSSVQSKFRKRTCNPIIDESFIFQVSLKCFEDRVIKLTVYDVERVRRHNVIGHALLPLKGREREVASDRGLLVSLDLQLSETIDSHTTTSGAEAKSRELYVALTYNDHVQRLLVGIIEGRNIKASSTSGTDASSSNTVTYVKVTLMRQNNVVKTKKTETVKRDSDPKFNESVSFKMSSELLDVSSVVIVVLQSTSGLKDRCVGRFVLGSYMFARGKELDHWNAMLAAPRQQICQWHVIA